MVRPRFPPDGRTGTLWDGRSKSSLVQAETELLLCQRDVKLNPVRAGLVVYPAIHRWSSDRANALGEPDVLLKPHALDLRLGDLRLALNQNQPVGNDRFYREIEAMTGQCR